MDPQVVQAAGVAGPVRPFVMLGHDPVDVSRDLVKPPAVRRTFGRMKHDRIEVLFAQEAKRFRGLVGDGCQMVALEGKVMDEGRKRELFMACGAPWAIV
jgi:hypothetical protein